MAIQRIIIIIKKQTTTGYILTFVKPQPVSWLYKQSLLLMPGYKTVQWSQEDAFDCDRHRAETFGLVSEF